MSPVINKKREKISKSKEYRYPITSFLFLQEDVNVIVVDWEKGSALPNYVQAAANTQLVGKQLAALIRMINYERGLSYQDYHLIGFSLGAHVAGFTGMECRNISRITGEYIKDLFNFQSF